jgi:hypothetical protein
MAFHLKRPGFVEALAATEGQGEALGAVASSVAGHSSAWLLQLESSEDWPARIQSTRIWLRTATTAEVRRFVDATADRFELDDSVRAGISRMFASLPSSVAPLDDPADWAAMASFGLG